MDTQTAINMLTTLVKELNQRAAAVQMALDLLNGIASPQLTALQTKIDQCDALTTQVTQLQAQLAAPTT